MRKAASSLAGIVRQMPRPVPAPAIMAMLPLTQWRHDRTVATSISIHASGFFP
jgi:hypothetical protein